MSPYSILARTALALLGGLATFSQAATTDITTVCKHYAQRLPNVSATQCQAARLQASPARSVKGRVIWTRDVKPVEAELRVLVVGGIHGDELSSASLPFHWIRMAEQSPAGHSAQAVHWRFIPALNPDGLFSARSRRVNANGVDLNRNFPTPNWLRDARVYWEQRTKRDPRRWPGTQSLSEPESRFLTEQMDSFKPDLIVSIHAPYGLLDFDGPSEPPSKLGRLFLDQVGVFPGSLGNYGGITRGVPVVTIELPSATRTPDDADIKLMWQDLLRWMGEKLARANQHDPASPRLRGEKTARATQPVQ